MKALRFLFLTVRVDPLQLSGAERLQLCIWGRLLQVDVLQSEALKHWGGGGRGVGFAALKPST